MNKNKYLQQGMTLIEILIAMVIGLVLMAGVVSLMINSKRAYNVQSDSAGLQENARFVVNSIAKDARMAGYQGCSGGLAQAVQGLNNQTVSGFTSAITSDVLLISFTDTSRNAFAIMHCPPFNVYGELFGLTSTTYQAACPPVGDVSFPAATPFTGETTTFNLGQNGGSFGVAGDINVNDTVIVSDCNGSARHQVSNVGLTGGRPTSVTLSTGLARNYFNGGQSYGSEMRRLVTHRYYVAGVNNRAVLCRDTANTLDTTAAPLNCTGNNAEALVDGVENMQLRYLVNTNTGDDSVTNPNFQYVPASGAINWDLVKGIRVTLLMQTTESRTDRDIESQSYSLDEEEFPSYTPTDLNRLRRVFSNTVMMRNRS
jgi:type IV pilus assembly protein PilW